MRERRARRSQQPIEALQLYLEAVRARAKASAVVLASADGLVVSGAGEHETNDVLAIVGARPKEHRDLEKYLAGPVRSAKIELEGATYFVASLGGAAISGKDTASAVSRILFTRAR